jgi:hypothetical protein
MTFDTVTKFKEWCSEVEADPTEYTVTHQGKEAGSKAFAFGKLKNMISDIA